MTNASNVIPNKKAVGKSLRRFSVMWYKGKGYEERISTALPNGKAEHIEVVCKSLKVVMKFLFFAIML